MYISMCFKLLFNIYRVQKKISPLVGGILHCSVPLCGAHHTFLPRCDTTWLEGRDPILFNPRLFKIVKSQGILLGFSCIKLPECLLQSNIK